MTEGGNARTHVAGGAGGRNGYSAGDAEDDTQCEDCIAEASNEQKMDYFGYDGKSKSFPVDGLIFDDPSAKSLIH